MRLKVLVNPFAGRGRTRTKVARALEVFRREGADLDVEESGSAEHLTELGRIASTSGYDRVVVCGGDGTVHHAVRAFDLDRGRMAVIPLGSGDDFAHALGIPSSPERAAQVALHGRIRSVDVARVNGIRYLVAASVGFDAAVARHASTVSHLRGSSIYLYSVLRVLRHFEPFGATIEEAGRSRQETLMFAVVANAYRYGGGIRIAPTAAIDDGLLDLYTVSVCTRMDLLMTLPLAYLGWHTRRRFVRASRITSLGLYSSVPREVFADGEFVTMTPARFDLAPQRLQVLA